ncbi:hypothetical protein [Thalassobacillus pellis]|uniref:ATP synthase beta subunit C-terminal domain-containing protein n=1 Tax=Thalassobacillus pellis TaxID=748008 RepID=UPI00196058E9|nr:hypothetical protein [Thalassobacillus pellis]MBM7552019.1 F-type H+-transporting ATPase subunit beta [Thalassobacillus pellis]
MKDIRLNVALLRRKVPNLTSAARSVGLRPATVSNLCTGKIPVGRAEVRTLVTLASLAECSLDELIIRGEKVDMIETGIKTLDLFAPLAKGGTVGLVARPGMGQLVILAELFHRLRKENYMTVLLKPEEEHEEVEDITEYADSLPETIDVAYQVIAGTSPDKNIIFAADRSHVLTGEIFDLQERLQQVGMDSVTTLLVDLKGEVVDEELPYGPLETLLQLDADLAARQLFPAVNPIYSTSSVLEGLHLDQTHQQIQQRAQKLLRRYRELRAVVNVKGIDSIPRVETITYKRGELLEAYLTQPFYVAEAFTGQKGETVALQDTIKDVRKIIDGSLDSKESGELRYIGSVV